MNLTSKKKLSVTFLLFLLVTIASLFSHADDTGNNHYFSWTLKVPGSPVSSGYLMTRLTLSQSPGSRNRDTSIDCCPFSLWESFSREAVYRIQPDLSSNPLPEDTPVWLFSQNYRSDTFTTETRLQLAVDLNGWCSGEGLCHGLGWCNSIDSNVGCDDVCLSILLAMCCPCVCVPCCLGRACEYTDRQNTATIEKLSSPESDYFSKRSRLHRLSVRAEHEIFIPPNRTTYIVHLTGSDLETQYWLRNMITQQQESAHIQVVFPGFLNNAITANFFTVPLNDPDQSHVIQLTNIDNDAAISHIYIYVSSPPRRRRSNENEYTIRRIEFYGPNIELTLNREDTIPQSLLAAPVLMQPRALPNAIPSAPRAEATGNYSEAPPPYLERVVSPLPENLYLPGASI